MNTNESLILTPVQLDSPWLPEWLNLYETAFPPQERLGMDYIAGLLERKAHGEAASVYPMAALIGDELVGLAIYRELVESEAMFLWYLAITPARRNQGLGAVIYNRLIEQGRGRLRAMLFDVEKPELAENETERNLRARRIDFYRRLGAKQLVGVNYVLKLDPENPVPLNLMMHSLVPLTGDQAFMIALQAVDDGWLAAEGQLALV